MPQATAWRFMSHGGSTRLDWFVRLEERWVPHTGGSNVVRNAIFYRRALFFRVSISRKVACRHDPWGLVLSRAPLGV